MHQSIRQGHTPFSINDEPNPTYSCQIFVPTLLCDNKVSPTLHTSVSFHTCMRTFYCAMDQGNHSSPFKTLRCRRWSAMASMITTRTCCPSPHNPKLALQQTLRHHIFSQSAGCMYSIPLSLALHILIRITLPKTNPQHHDFYVIRPAQRASINLSWTRKRKG